MMYSSKQQILQLLVLLKAHGVRQVVLSPGARNAPVVQSLAGDPFFVCHSVVDERSAGFYALGIAQYTGQTVAVCCTSGTAVLNYAPSLAEAFYQQLPLVYITADRPPARIDQMEGQTLPQPGIFGPLAKKSVQLPEITSDRDEWYCNRLLNEALLAATHPQGAPVHINLPLSEPLFEYTANPLPPARTIHRHEPLWASFHPLGERFRRFRRPLLLVGQQTDATLLAPLDCLEQTHRCLILAEHPANLPPRRFPGNFDALLRSLPEETLPLYAPDLVITLGGHLLSRHIRHFLRTHPPREHWHVSADGKITDTYQCLTDTVVGKASHFAAYLAGQDPPGECADARREYLLRWQSASLGIPEPEAEYSDLAACGALLRAMDDHACLQLSNSSSVRLAQLFRPAANHLRIHANRGTSGIDGCLSTAVGQACVNPGLTFLVIGDLAFFYDMNILWNRRLPPRLRILLNNNGGGGIFPTLPGFVPTPEARQHILVRHSQSARSWAESQGLAYLGVSNQQELQDAIPPFVSPEGNQPMLMEVFTSQEKNTEVLLRYYASLRRG
ncbi:MAG: 2-succinyl-5-enolpyruvyl-6-hydroxy-3-cyclohexene-1-carboxylic-acid synthase [Tannerellaceae bacterium]|jgi:2-succinyl-5-enolpyruvyl-6-hydroxy-3-cyclohexene-1-carboxylate synthase|nr:2-succinyl-5-enolpyruvyl-6-hydroxy-3-cyclohexene-1-carboxylic-acid synthase [Tannerellaceae bacterium]